MKVIAVNGKALLANGKAIRAPESTDGNIVHVQKVKAVEEAPEDIEDVVSYSFLDAPDILDDAQASEVESGTSLTASITADHAGWVLATVATRSTTTYPEGWTLLHETTPMPNGSNQRMAFLCKEVSAGEVSSITIKQSSAGRIYINMTAWNGISGFSYTTGSETVRDDNTSNSIVAEKATSGNVVWGATCNYANDGYTWNTMRPSMLPICQLTTSNPRLVNFYDVGEAGERTFLACSTSSSMTVDYVNILE